MYCPRLDHFVRFNFNGTVSRCGHMVSAPQFNSLEDMDASDWLQNIKSTFEQDIFPRECQRCQQTEEINGTSIRLNATNFDQHQIKKDYLTVGGVLDNVCNSACFTCSPELSTKIGSLYSNIYPIVDNADRFWRLPMHRVVHLDINGGEPSASKNYRYLLQNIPDNVKSVRINTNCSVIIPEIEELLNRNIKITVTVSLDGIESVHDFVRWPIKWSKFYKNLMTYKNMPGLELNTWTTVSALNIGDFKNILAFVNEHGIDHSYALLHNPDVLSVKYINSFTLEHQEVIPGQVAVGKNNQTDIDAFMIKQKHLRGVV
jgi:sulfatase maturation enzyme AslB (radical SAM superfamily)